MTTSPLCPGDCPSCFYCEADLIARHEHDHFPIPGRHGGEVTVSACMNCHDLKDRIAIKNWRVDLLVEAVRQAGPLGRILLAKLSDRIADFEAAAEERAA
jgi:hypothetical protein